ncbi:MAG TPA: YafY family protein [Ktedonobacteraceae bacterium]|nr:YafY family protein [Ktedonobacteraceae bacterium]
MNRTDRLLAIVLELQAKGRQRAEDLAATFETSKRTIYRDILALGEAGVPLVSVPGRGYSLMKGYFLPPLSFTTEEATMLLLGSEFMAHNFDAQYRAAAQSASRKIEGVLPEKLRGEVQYLRSNIRFIVAITRDESREMQMLQQLRRAIIDRVTVRFHYHARYSRNGQGDEQTREADPYGLAHVGHSWYLGAYCHLRKDMRNFRLERMDGLELLPRTFIRPADFEVGPRAREEQSGIIARALFDHETSRWVRESRWYDTISEEETAQGLLVTLKIRQESEIMQWLLGWGQHVRVLEPDSLREKLAREAAAMLQNYRCLE